VTAVLVNAGHAESGLAKCSKAVSMPIVQDNTGGDLWSALGAKGYNALVFDGSILVHKISAAYFAYEEEAVAELEAVVTSLLED